MLKALSIKDAARTSISIEACSAASPRVNASLTALPSGELLLFGGEFYDGASNQCFNDLYRIQAPGSSGTTPWAHKAILSATVPLPRCSHVSVLLESKKEVILYGGEFSTASQFYHHGDTWRMDVSTGAWTRADSKKAPTPRSGARAGAWRGGVLLFGGFYQTLTSDKWFGDTWLFDARVGAAGWTQVIFPTSSLPAPAARSGHGFVVLAGRDLALLAGGYSEVAAGGATDVISATTKKGGSKGAAGGSGSMAAFLNQKSRSVVHNDVWLLRLSNMAAMWSVPPGASTSIVSPTWERVRTLGIPPSIRTGFSLAVYRDRVILFGGVTDADADDRGESVASVFHNDIYAFDIGRRRWFELALRSRDAPVSRRGGASAGGGSRSQRKPSATATPSDDADAAAAADDDDDAQSEADEADAAEQASTLAAARSGKGTASGDGHLDVDEEAYYMYVDGKLVRLEPEEEPASERAEREAVEKAAAARVAERLAERAAIADEQRRVEAVAAVETKLTISSSVSASAVAVAAPITAATPLMTATALLPAPPGRLRAQTWVDGHWLYVFGGLREEPLPGRAAAAARRLKSAGKELPTGAVEGDVEVTLDDVWRIDLRDRVGGWVPLVEGNWRRQVWRGDKEASSDEESVDDDDDEDESSSGSGSGSGSGSSNGSGDEDNSDDDGGIRGGRGKRGGKGGGKGVSRGGGSIGASAARHARSAATQTPEALRARELRDVLGLEDPTVTPLPGDDLRSFFVRTASAWTQALMSGYVTRLPRAEDYDSGSDIEAEGDAKGGAKGGGVGGSSSSSARALAAERARATAAAARLREGERLVGKEIRRRAFVLARQRYDEVWPTLAELAEMEAAQIAYEAELARRAAEDAVERARRAHQREKLSKKKGGKA